tara:strand:+ start:360 stop:578 length:219 start_codon:yes stop_codon:yes gene_type:complete
MQNKFNLTERQREIFDYMVLHYKASGMTPTQRDTAEHFNVSQATIAKHLAAIEKRGWIQRASGMKNAMSILE